MSIYSILVARGYTDEQIRSAADDATLLPPGSAGIAIQDTPDGTPIVGIKYACDFRTEEEVGVGDLVRAFRDYPRQADLVQVYGTGTILLGTKLLTETMNLHQLLMFKTNLDYDTAQVQESEAMKLRNDKAVFLQSYAEVNRIDISSAKSRDEVFSILLGEAKRLKPDLWPAWFHYGNILILSASQGIVRDVIELIAEQAASNNIMVSAGDNFLGGGLSVCSRADVGPKLQAEWDRERAWYKEQLDKVEPVKAELTRRGYGVHALGNPRLRNGGPEVEYWINCHLYAEGQPYGWYTLEELLAEKFMTDMRQEKAKQEARRKRNKAKVQAKAKAGK